ncbi:hypothetical protein B6U70_01085 [Euryarchaeota archaeon ex4484_162]|nr:MAG: hypothetical protein B6U70_01085 [Euryarchaeota archaeon ex4484_162]RLF35275.1 MAG: hypothetical protein DRN08_03300 [Thermoplasmata archaeon]
MILLFDLILIFLFCILGVCIGVVTGLLPGLHVNNIAIILLSMSGMIVALCHPLYVFGFSESFLFLLISVFIISTSVSHTFHDAIPTTFLGAPEEDTALSILPAHALLLEGRGYEAIYLSAFGSFSAIMICFLLIYPIRFLIGSPLMLYSTLREIMPWVLIAISILMIATERGRINDSNIRRRSFSIFSGMLFASLVFFLAGAFGLIVLDLPVDSPLGLSSPVLFPALSGLFGTPTLINSLMTKPVIPEQRIEEIVFSKKEKGASILSAITGSLAGILVSIIPGITSATGTILAMNIRGESSNRQTIVTLSAVNTASAFSVILVLFIILRPRSGVALAVNELVAVEEWNSLFLPSTLVYLIIAILLAGCLSYFLTLKIGGLFAKHFQNISYSSLIVSTIVMIILLVFLFTGIIGLLVLMVATLIGLLPVLWGVRRSHCMGILLIPVILHFI